MFDLWNSLDFWRLLAIAEAIVALLSVPIVSLLWQRFKNAQRHSQTDHLTGLANKRLFDNVWEYNLALTRRDDRMVSLMLIDLDDLKQINDRLGHDMGNQAIVLVANAIRETVHRETDLGARIGGDEFAVILHGGTIDGARSIAKQITHKVSELSEILEVKVSVSIGLLAYYPTAGLYANADDLFKLADQAMYKAKKAGGNQVYTVAEGVPNHRGVERL